MKPLKEEQEVDCILLSLHAIAGTCDADDQAHVADCMSLIFAGAPCPVAYRIKSRDQMEAIIETMNKVADRLWPRRNP